MDFEKSELNSLNSKLSFLTFQVISNKREELKLEKNRKSEVDHDFGNYEYLYSYTSKKQFFGCLTKYCNLIQV